MTQIESGKPFIFTATVALKPEVTLGEYKGIEVEKKEVEVTKIRNLGKKSLKEVIDKVKEMGLNFKD